MAALEILITGVIATVALDLWQQIYRLLFGAPITNWAMIGRWAAGIPKGRLVYDNIGKAPPVANELALGWGVHYAVGIGYAVVYLFLMWFIVRSPPDFVSAIVFGSISVCVTWFVIEPMLGAGAMASKTPKQSAAMAHDFTSHLSFGFGLFVGSAVAQALAGA